MQIQPTISFEQYKLAYEALAAAKKPQERILMRMILYGCLLAFGIFMTFDERQRWQAALLVAFAGLALLAPWLRQRSKEKCYRKFYDEEQRGLNSQELLITEQGIDCMQKGGTISSHYDWQAFQRKIRVGEDVLFLPSPNSFVRVPTSKLSTAQREELDSWSKSVPAN